MLCKAVHFAKFVQNIIEGEHSGARSGEGTNLASPRFIIIYICTDLDKEFQIIFVVHRQENLEGKRPAGGMSGNTMFSCLLLHFK